MKTRAWAALRLAPLLVALAGLALAGCQTTVGDLEKWRNRRGSEDKFVEWMLNPDASPQVRAKAIEMLFEQYNYEGDSHLPRVGDLPAQPRDQAIRDALPHVRELFDGTEFSLGGQATGQLRPVQVRDGAVMLLATTDTQETQAAILDAILVPWLRQHYRPCITSSGRHPNSRILSMVGAERGLPIVIGYLREGSFDDIFCQNSYLGDVAWLPETAEELATAYTERYTRSRPETVEGLRQYVLAMITVPNSRVLKNWIFEQLLEGNDPLLPDVVDAFLNYVRPLTDPADADRYALMIQRFDGFLRWIGFENVVRLRGPDGIGQALGAIPDAGRWGRWGGEPLEDGLKRAATWVCERPLIREQGDAARSAFEANLEANNLVARAVAIQCLGELGTADSIPFLEQNTNVEAAIPSWGNENNTVGALAQEVIERIQSRQ